MSVEKLIIQNIDLWASAIKAKAIQGRGISKKRELYGIRKLRELILELAVRGMLVPQDPDEEPASLLLDRIASEKQQLVKQMIIKKPKKLAEISASELPFTLPTGWKWARLQDLTSYIQRGMGPQYDDFGIVRVVSQKCVQWSGFDLEASRNVANESLGKYQKERFLQAGDLLWNSTGTGTVGRIVELDEVPAKTLVADSHVTVVRPFEILGGFLRTYIAAPAIQGRFDPGHQNSLVSGTTNQVELNTSGVEKLEVPVPPMAEQHRIVAKVDELMVLCDQLEQQTEINLESHQLLVDALLGSLIKSNGPENFSENWKRLSDNFDELITSDYAVEQLRKTILHLAVMGALVPQDPADEPASTLLALIAAEKDQLIKDKQIKKQQPLPGIAKEELQFELPAGWSWTQCANTSKPETIITYGIIKPVWVDNGVSTVRIKDMKDGKILLDDIAQCSIDRAIRFNKTTLLENDLLVAKDGATLGKTAFVPRELVGGNITQHVLRLSITDKLNREFIRLIIDSPIGQDWMKGETKGVALPGVNVGDFRRMPMAIPPLNEQHRIVTKVSQLMALCDQLKARLSDAQTTQLLLSDAVVNEVVGEPVQNMEVKAVDRDFMKITTILSLNHEQFDDSAVIAKIIRDLGGAADAKDVWNKTQLSLPEFYAQLKIEIDAQYIVRPASAIF